MISFSNFGSTQDPEAEKVRDAVRILNERHPDLIVDGEMEIAPGVIIHPAFRAHTAGSQLLEVPTSIGKLVFGSDAYSSYEGIRDWMV